MKFQHAKSPCCGAGIRRFGPKRRQCLQCHHTWTIRPQKRGRPARRTHENLLHRVLVEGFTLEQLFSKRTTVELPAYRYRFRQALRKLVSGPPPQAFPEGPLVLLVDGLWFSFKDKPWVLYLMAVKACRGSEATFLDPLLIPGREGAQAWRQAISNIPPRLDSRIRAITADNLPGMKKVALEKGWRVQLCHFHLLMKLMAIRHGLRYSLRGGKVREEINAGVRAALTFAEGVHLEKALSRLARQVESDCGTRRIKTNLGEFLKTFEYYRTYLKHPELGLPHTTNAVESMCRLIREMFRSSRAGSSPASVQLWATALIRMRPNVTCNGHPINRII